MAEQGMAEEDGMYSKNIHPHTGLYIYTLRGKEKGDMVREKSCLRVICHGCVIISCRPFIVQIL